MRGKSRKISLPTPKIMSLVRTIRITCYLSIGIIRQDGQSHRSFLMVKSSSQSQRHLCITVFHATKGLTSFRINKQESLNLLGLINTLTSSWTLQTILICHFSTPMSSISALSSWWKSTRRGSHSSMILVSSTWDYATFPQTRWWEWKLQVPPRYLECSTQPLSDPRISL